MANFSDTACRLNRTAEAARHLEGLGIPAVRWLEFGGFSLEQADAFVDRLRALAVALPRFAQAMRALIGEPLGLDELAQAGGIVLGDAREAIQLAGVSTPVHAMLWGMVDRQKAIHGPGDWQAATFDAALDCLAPELKKGDRVKGCFVLADAFDEEAAQIETELAKIDAQVSGPNNGGATGAAPDGPKEPATTKGATVNARIMDLLAARPEASGWSTREIAVALGCGHSQVAACLAYKTLAASRELARLVRAEKAQQTNQRRDRK
jgi:hypothetical protein